jgi:hypothetical protein
MPVQFNSNVANALVHGHPLPVPLVVEFCRDAYDTMLALQEAKQEIERLKYAADKASEGNVS